MSKILKKSETISTEGIRLRSLEEKDLELLRNWRNNVRDCFIDNRYINEEQQKKWFYNYIDNANDIMFIIEETTRLLRPVGVASLYNIIYRNEAEFGRFIIGDKEAVGTGIGKKTMKVICEYGFDILKLKKINLEVLETNFKAVNMYMKEGFEIISSYNIHDRNMIKMTKVIGE